MTAVLVGKRIAITRAREQADSLVEALQAQGATVVAYPAIRFASPADTTELDAALFQLASYDWCMFTSANAVRFLVERLATLQLGVDVLRTRRVVAVGPATAAALATYAIPVAAMPTHYLAESLLSLFGHLHGQRVLLPRADLAREALAWQLRERGAVVDDVTLYCTLPGEGIAGLHYELRTGTLDVLVFSSGSTARYSIEGLLAEPIHWPAIVCIGPATAAVVREYGLIVTAESAVSTNQGLVTTICQLFTESNP